MVRKLLAAVGLTLAASAGAAPVLPPGPLYIQFSNLEQISAGNNIVSPSGASEGNWGVLVVSNMEQGGAIPPDQLFNPGGGSGFPFFTNSATGQITGIFYGTRVVAPGCTGCLDAAGGFIDLYFQNPTGPGGTTALLATALPSMRTADNLFTNFTDGEFLARLAFASGIDPGNSGVHIRGTTTPSTAGFTGFADSFAEVVDTNSDGVIDAADGSYAASLNSDFFNTAFGQRDIRLKNSYNGPVANWSDPGAGTTNDIFGANSSDPVRAFVVPEPGTLGLLGISLIGLAALRRKKTVA